jgi:hypothetical protein
MLVRKCPEDEVIRVLPAHDNIHVMLCVHHHHRYEGPLQKWTVAALTSRSVWTNIGNFITAPFVYSASFGSLSNGMPCAAFTFAIYATGSICLLVAHWLDLAS